MTPSRRVINSLLKRALKMRKSTYGTSKLHILADVVSPFQTTLACFTWYPHFQGHSVPNPEVLHRGSYRGYNPCGFVAQRHGLPDLYISIAVVLVVVEVGAAKTS